MKGITFGFLNLTLFNKSFHYFVKHLAVNSAALNMVCETNM